MRLVEIYFYIAMIAGMWFLVGNVAIYYNIEISILWHLSATVVAYIWFLVFYWAAMGK